jgi:hypothetical protein
LPLRTIRHKAETGELEWKLSDLPADNRKPERLYNPAQFPINAQLKRLTDAEAISKLDALVPLKSDTPTNQPVLYVAPLIPFASPELAGLTDEQREVARRRYDAMLSIVNWRTDPHPFGTGCRQVRSQTDLVKYIARQQGVGPSAVWKWLARYEKGGETPLAKFKALADRARCDRGKLRVLKQYPKAAEYALIKYLGLAPSQYLEAARELKLPAETGLDHSMPRFMSERLPITAVYQGIAREWPNWYNHGSKPPSYGTILNFLKSLPGPVVTLARQGARA